MKRGNNIGIGIGILIILAALPFSALPGIFDEIWSRRPNEHEEFYRYVAQEIDAPDLCDKISWAATLPETIESVASFYRSACYETLAINTKDATLCSKVRRLGAITSRKQQLSPESCAEHAHENFSTGIAIPDRNLIRFFSKMGYDPDALDKEGVTPAIVSIPDNYRKMVNDKTSIEHAKTKLSQPGIGDEQVAYLADMIALASGDAEWCAHIPTTFLVGKAPMRDWCYFTVASNSRNEALCNKVPVRPDEKDPRISLHASCLFQVRSPYPDTTRYSAEVPKDETIVRAIMALLEYPITQAKDLPPYETATAYKHFLHELNPRPTAQRRFNKNFYSANWEERRAAARKRLIDRVNRLSSFP